MSALSINVYPSTNDYKPIKGGSHSDELLNILITARERYAEHGTSGVYISSRGDVCALGAIFVADGKTNSYLVERYNMVYQWWMERELSTLAKAAIEELNMIAEEWLTSHPHIKLRSNRAYNGALEQINEQLNPEDIKPEPVILEIYDEAIRRRELIVDKVLVAT